MINGQRMVKLKDYLLDIVDHWQLIASCFQLTSKDGLEKWAFLIRILRIVLKHF
jgi:hypothetical protein